MNPHNDQFSFTRVALRHRSLFSTCTLIAALLLILSAAGLRAEPATPPATRTSQGEKMERQIWAEIKNKNWKAVESKIATGFQSVHQDGARDRAAEIALIKQLNASDISFTDFKSTTNGNDIVVTYMISVQETIDGKPLSTNPAPRLSVWRRAPSGWQWISHANLNPLRQP